MKSTKSFFFVELATLQQNLESTDACVLRLGCLCRLPSGCRNAFSAINIFLYTLGQRFAKHGINMKLHCSFLDIHTKISI